MSYVFILEAQGFEGFEFKAFGFEDLRAFKGVGFPSFKDFEF